MANKPPIYLVAQRKARTYMNGWVPPFGILCVGKALQEAGYRVRAFHLSGDDDEALMEAVRGERPLFVGFSKNSSFSRARGTRDGRFRSEPSSKPPWQGREDL